MDSPLIRTTRSRLRRFRGHYRTVSERAGLTYSWVSKFATGEVGARPRYDLLDSLLTTLDAMEREDHARRRGQRSRKAMGA